MKRTTFNKGMALLMAAFPDFKGFEGNNTSTIEVYWQMLKEFHENDFARIVKQIIGTKKYFPKIAELREELNHSQNIREGMTAAAEWEKILKAAEAGKDKPNISKTAERALSIVGGYDQFRITNYDSLRYVFNKFESVYKNEMENEQLRIQYDTEYLAIENKQED